MTDALLEDGVEQFLDRCCSLREARVVEADESGHAAADLWKKVHASGFADALVPEERDGAGLQLASIGPIAFGCGRHALPLPLTQTMVARAALAEMDVRPPEGAIAISVAASIDSGSLTCPAVPYGLTAEWVLVPLNCGDTLLPTRAAQRTRSGGHGSLAADLYWASIPSDSIQLQKPVERIDWLSIAAALVAAQMSGAMERVTEMTIEYANSRSQFGRPIGKLQAIQQQISVMAEQSYASRSAALLGLASDSWCVHWRRAAVAKSRANDAATVVVATGHAVHGAIGITAEFDLQMFTRRLHDWRGCYGSATYWNERLGQALLDEDVSAVEFALERIRIGSTVVPGSPRP